MTCPDEHKRWGQLRARAALLGWMSWRSDDPTPVYFIGRENLDLGMVPDLDRLERIVAALETTAGATMIDRAFHTQRGRG